MMGSSRFLTATIAARSCLTDSLFARRFARVAVGAIALLATATAIAAPAGGLQFFTDEGAFDAALGVPTNLTVEHFDGGAPVGPFPKNCTEPLNADTNDACFAPGQVVAGFAMSSTGGGGLTIFPNTFLGPQQTTRTIGASTFADSTVVSFSPAASAAAARAYGGTAVSIVDVEVFDESGASLGSTTLPATATRDISSFVGVISATPIGKITFNSEASGTGELLDDLQFRPAGTAPPGLAKAFSPAAIDAGSTSTLTITLGNQGQPGVATLSADLVDTFPSGLVVADVPNATTDCANGTVTAAAGAGSVSLSAGAEIPGSGTCTVSVDVTAASAGLYSNTLPAGTLATDLGDNTDPASADLKVGTGAGTTFPPGENFDEVFVPSLPSGWTTSNASGGDDWTTVTSASDSAPNAAHAPEQPNVVDYTLDTPAFTMAPGQTVTFRHKYNLEHRFDGAVLEISIDGGAFADITDAGGTFLTGGYGFAINDSTGNPLAGRYAWTGDSNGFVTTSVALPDDAVGHSVELRFRTADDGSQTAEGDNGWWVDSIELGVAAAPPSATISSGFFQFDVDVGETASDTLTLGNAAGAGTLTFNVQSRGFASLPGRLIPYAGGHHGLFSKALGASKPRIARAPATIDARAAGASRTLAAASPWAPAGSILFQLDDGSIETSLGSGSSAGEQATVWINRFSASAALDIHSITIGWPPIDLAGGDLLGLEANLVVYYDADADGDPSNAVRIGTDDFVPISATGAFQTYDTDFAIPGAGDVYIGFVDQWALAGGFMPRMFPASLDTTSPQGMSYLSSVDTPPVDIDHLGNNDHTGTLFDIEQGALDGNWMIRASALGGGGGGPCSGPIVDWLSATPTSGSIEGGDSTDLTITVDPAAANLGAGSYHADVCITTNDPAQALIAIPVTLNVTAPAPTPCSASDEIFCDGFDGSGGGGGGSIVSGTIDQPVVESLDGSSFDFATGDYHGYDPNVTSDDINLYEVASGGGDDGMYVYWYGDAVPPDFSASVGGVVDSSGQAFAVLHSGDTVGPSSTVSAASTLMTSWIGGSDGYVGVAFYNEKTNAVNYGYLHLTTTAPLGFPAEALDWAYDSSGAAITIP